MTKQSENTRKNAQKRFYILKNSNLWGKWAKFHTKAQKRSKFDFIQDNWVAQIGEREMVLETRHYMWIYV